jgi:hypothetical protein
MLVLDLADDLLDEIFDRHQPLGSRILVQHDRQMGTGGAHLRQQIQHAHRFGHVARLADQPGDRVGGRAAAGEDAEHVLDMDHADHVIQALAIYRQPAVSGLGKGGDQIGERDRLLYGDDVRPRHADPAHVALPEMEQVTQHLPLDRGEITDRRRIAFMIVNRFLDLVAKGGLAILAEDQATQAAPQSAAATLRGVGGTGIVGHFGSVVPCRKIAVQLSVTA